MIKKYVAIIFVALFLSAMSRWLGSEYIISGFPDTAIVSACAMLAIYLTAICTLFSQLDMLRDKYKSKFENTIRNIRFALIELLVSILSIILLKIIVTSRIFKDTLRSIDYISELFSFLLMLFTIAIVSIIYDSVISVINAFEFRTKND